MQCHIPVVGVEIATAGYDEGDTKILLNVFATDLEYRIPGAGAAMLPLLSKRGHGVDDVQLALRHPSTQMALMQSSIVLSSTQVARTIRLYDGPHAKQRRVVFNPGGSDNQVV